CETKPAPDDRRRLYWMSRASADRRKLFLQRSRHLTARHRLHRWRHAENETAVVYLGLSLHNPPYSSHAGYATLRYYSGYTPSIHQSSDPHSIRWPDGLPCQADIH